MLQQVAASCSAVTVVVVCRLFHSARSCKIGSAKCSNFKPKSVYLPRYWPMDWWLPGAIDADEHHVAVVSFFPGRGPPDNYSGVIPRHFPAGCCQMQRSDSSCVQTVPQCKIMQDRLSKVQQLQATERAFAAILADGLVTTWGDRCRQTPRCCGLIFSWQRTSRQLQRCHSAAFSSRLLPNAAEWQ